jgi:hypothetical protein
MIFSFLGKLCAIFPKRRKAAAPFTAEVYSSSRFLIFPSNGRQRPLPAFARGVVEIASLQGHPYVLPIFSFSLWVVTSSRGSMWPKDSVAPPRKRGETGTVVAQPTS